MLPKSEKSSGSNGNEAIKKLPLLPPCKVCGEKASGLHYGVNTCEACKAFFRRSLQRGKAYRCHEGGACMVQAVRRNRCSACRFKKCTDLGMCREAIKTGRYTHEKKINDMNEIKRLDRLKQSGFLSYETPMEIEQDMINDFEIQKVSSSTNKNDKLTDESLNLQLSEDLEFQSFMELSQMNFQPCQSTWEQPQMMTDEEQFNQQQQQPLQQQQQQQLQLQQQHKEQQQLQLQQLHTYNNHSIGTILNTKLNSYSHKLTNNPDSMSQKLNASTFNEALPSPLDYIDKTSPFTSSLSPPSLLLTPSSPSYLSPSSSLQKYSSPSSIFPSFSSPLSYSPNSSPQPNSLSFYSSSSPSDPTSSSSSDPTSSSSSDPTSSSSSSVSKIPSSLDLPPSQSSAPSSSLPPFFSSPYSSSSLSFPLSMVSPNFSLLQASSPSDVRVVSKTRELQLEAIIRNISETRLKNSKFNEDFYKQLPIFQQEYLERRKLQTEVFGSLKPLSKDEYNLIFLSTGIDVDGRKEYLINELPHLEHAVRRFISFAKTIPGFNSFSIEDQISLIKSSKFEAWMLFGHRLFNVEHMLYTGQSGMVVSGEDMKKVNNSQMVDDIFKLQQKINKMDLSHEETCIMAALCVMSCDTYVLENPGLVDHYQELLLECLLHLFNKKRPLEPLRFAKFTDCLLDMKAMKLACMREEEEFVVEWSSLLEIPKLVYEIWSS